MNEIKYIILFFMLLSVNFTTYAKKSDDLGMIILLNGPSASGKSSIQKKIQEHFDEPFLAVGIDSLFDQLLPDYYGLGQIHPKGKFSEEDIRSVETISVDGKNAIKLNIGPIGRKVISGMHHAMSAYAHQGNNLVVDYILYDVDWFKELVQTTNGVKVYYIGIKYPLEVIESREAKRSTSPVGHARSHFYSVHHFNNYDFTIEDPNLTAQEIALKIKEYVKQNPKPQAFINYSNDLTP